jgi:hypothetical protein
MSVERLKKLSSLWFITNEIKGNPWLSHILIDKQGKVPQSFEFLEDYQQ